MLVFARGSFLELLLEQKLWFIWVSFLFEGLLEPCERLCSTTSSHLPLATISRLDNKECVFSWGITANCLYLLQAIRAERIETHAILCVLNMLREL